MHGGLCSILAKCLNDMYSLTGQLGKLISASTGSRFGQVPEFRDAEMIRSKYSNGHTAVLIFDQSPNIKYFMDLWRPSLSASWNDV